MQSDASVRQPVDRPAATARGPGPAAATPPASDGRDRAGTWLIRLLARFRHDESAAVLIEAALVMPLLVIMLAAISEWGIALYDYHQLSVATGAAMRQLVVNRGFPNSYSNVTAQYGNYAKQLNVQTANITVSIQTTSGGAFNACNTDTACGNYLDSAQGLGAKIAVSYPCQLTFTPQMASPCPLQITMTGLVD